MIINGFIKDVIKANKEERGIESSETHHKQIQEKLLQMYSEVKDLEAQLSNTSLAKMVLMNDLKRILLLKKGKLNEADEASKENYRSMKRAKNERQSCDAAICLLFKIDIENEWGQMLICKNGCKIHLRCEGIALVDENEELPDDYQCKQCETNRPNGEWIEESLKVKNREFTKTQTSLNVQITSLTADIAHNERLEESDQGKNN